MNCKNCELYLQCQLSQIPCKIIIDIAQERLTSLHSSQEMRTLLHKYLHDHSFTGIKIEISISTLNESLWFYFNNMKYSLYRHNNNPTLVLIWNSVDGDKNYTGLNGNKVISYE